MADSDRVTYTGPGDPEVLARAAMVLCGTAAQRGWRGPDPYDGLWWRWPRWLASGRRRRQLITQAHVRTPVDIRRLYRREHPLLAKTAALFASASLHLDALRHEFGRPLALDALRTVMDDSRAGASDAWGYPFDVQTRWSFYPANEPSIVPTAFAVTALLEAERRLGREEFGARGRSAARWVLDTLWVDGPGFFAYHPHSAVNVHNANMLGARLVWEAFGEAARDPVRRAVTRTLEAQRPDGGWPYGEGDRALAWADSFHSGYVLLCLAAVRDVDPAIDDALARGAAFYARFFGPRGESRLWSNRSYPEDGHSAGTGLSALAALQRLGYSDPDLLKRVTDRVLDAGIRGGHAVFRRYRAGMRSYVQYPRWCDGHLALGLSDAALLAAGASEPTVATPAPS